MLAQTRRKITRAESVQVFHRDNPSTDPAVVTLVAALEAQLERARTLVQARGEHDASAQASTELSRRHRRRLRRGLMRLFRRAGQAAANGDPGLAPLFQPFRPRITHVDFAAAARSMIDAARAHAEALASQGVTPELVDQAETLLDSYVGAADQALAGRNGRVKANAELTVVGRDLMAVIGRLDSLNQHRFADDPEVLAAWTSALEVGGPIASRKRRPAVATDPQPPAPPPASGGVSATG